MRAFRLSAVLSIFVLLSSGLNAGDWNQWRGPNRTGEVAEGTSLPASLSDDQMTLAWSMPLAPGYSGPIVGRDRVFVTETLDAEREIVRALDLSGKELWKTDWPGAMTVPFFAAANGSWIRSTPAWDGERLYVAGMLDVLVALDGANGDEVWRVDFTQQFSTPVESFGFVCSPLIVDGYVYVQTGAGLIKLVATTGEIVWRGLAEEGGMMGGAFSSPVIATLCDVQQLVVQSRSRLCGVDPATGEELWGVEIPSFRGMNILTPTIMGDRVFTSSYGGGTYLFTVSRSESGLTVTQDWQKNVEAYMSSPVEIDGHIYLHLRNQRFTCLNAASSETRWTTRPFGKYWSIVKQQNQILALDERGDLLLVDATPDEFRERDRRHISDSPTWAHLAVAGNRAYVRTLDGLFVYQWPVDASTAGESP